MTRPATDAAPTETVAPAGSGTPLRITIEPGEDVDVRPGVRLAVLRPVLARVLGRDDLLDAPLVVDDHVLDDDALTGHFPLLAGARAHVAGAWGDAVVPRRAASGTGAPGGGPGPVAPAAAPVRAAVGVADAPVAVHVTSGPLAGRILAPEDAGRLAGVRLRQTSRGVRASSRRPGARPRLARRGRTRRVGLLPLRLRHLDELTVPGTGARAAPTTLRVVRAEPQAPARLPAGSWALLLAPACSSLVLAAVMGRPALAALALVGPVALVVQLLARRRARPAATTAAAAPAPAPTWHETSRDPCRALAVLSGAPLPVPSDSGTAPAGASRGGARARDAEDGDADDGAWHGPTVPAGAPGPVQAVAATGPAAAARARALVCAWAVLHPGRPVTVVGPAHARDSWAWTRWLPRARASSPGPALVVVLPGALDGPALTSWWAHHDPDHRLVLVAPDGVVPAWCHGAADGPGVDEAWADDVARALAGRRGQGAPGRGGDPRVLATAGRPALPAPPGAAGPDVVPLADLLGLATGGDLAAAVQQRWSGADGSPRAPLGVEVRADGSHVPFVLDLVAHGPHGLVAGTTGAGKSELLQTLVCALALTCPPSQLAVVLVDYKGGASFGECADLPHVVGLVTDLEPGLAGRALAGLRAEIARRERLVRSSGSTTLDEHRARAAPDAEPVPRMLVVVDEFRALSEDEPRFVPALLRLAAQGRSLGMHLVLATQRPGGAVTADMRANLGLRIALRVTDAAESSDVVDVPDARALPASCPGRAVVVTSGAGPRLVHAAYAAAPPGAGARTATARRCPPWTPSPTLPGHDVVGPAPRAVTTPTPTPMPTGGVVAAPRSAPGPGAPVAPGAARLRDSLVVGTGGPGALTGTGGPGALAGLHARAPGQQRPSLLPALVAAARTAAARTATGPPRRPWLPALPAVVPLARALGAVEGPPAGLVVALTDVPDEQRRDVAAWLPSAGHLVIEGGPRSGRTTALRSLAAQALARGHDVHVVGPSGIVDATHPGAGTVVGTQDPRRVAELLATLAGGRPDRPQIVLVDDLDAVQECLGRVDRGAGAELLAALGRAADARAALVLATARPVTGALGARAGARLVLGTSHANVDVGRGVPAALAGLGTVPGRGVWFGSGPPVLCQVVVPGDEPPLGRDRPTAAVRIRPVPRHVPDGPLGADVPGVPLGPGVPGGPGGPGGPDGAGGPDGPGRAGGPGGLLGPDGLVGQDGPVRPVLLDGPDGHGATAWWRVPLGVGGPDAGPRALDVSRGALVAGPPGSGRSTVLARVARHVGAAGRALVVVALDGPLLDVRADDALTEASAPAFARLLARLAERAGAPGPDDGRGPVLVVDDVTTLAQLAPVDLDRLTSSPGIATIVLAGTTGAVSLTSRGAVGAARARRTGVLLDAATPGSADVFGTSVARLVDPGTCPPGRGVLVHGSRAELVQCASFDAALGA